MHKAKLTKRGARVLGRPSLAGKIVCYDELYPSPPCGRCVRNVYFDGQRLGSNLSYAGESPGVELLETPDSD